MSDENDKPAENSGRPTGKPQTPDNASGSNFPHEEIAAPGDGEIDLARLAPQLRGLYRELLAEPIPDRFTKLLDELASKETDGQ